MPAEIVRVPALFVIAPRVELPEMDRVPALSVAPEILRLVAFSVLEDILRAD